MIEAEVDEGEDEFREFTEEGDGEADPLEYLLPGRVTADDLDMDDGALLLKAGGDRG